MRLPMPPRRPAREPVLPMINVVFLLLVFFLMTAQIAPAPPFDLALPEVAMTDEAAPAPERVLWLGADGAMVHDGAQGPAALAVLALGEGPVLIRADAGLPAADLARLMRELSALGISDTRLSVQPRGTP